mmetsp:Transcript_13728/g.29852  ORF Transcript_13728/g.29852 Transcript_13728/m.29852 type:complete len:91 (+) Transcript_13728:183-455(+)
MPQEVTQTADTLPPNGSDGQTCDRLSGSQSIFNHSFDSYCERVDNGLFLGWIGRKNDGRSECNGGRIGDCSSRGGYFEFNTWATLGRVVQ